MATLTRWNNVWSRLGCNISENILEQHYNILISAYQEHQRYYHNLTHLNQVLVELDWAKNKKTELTDQEYAELEIALWFHDVIYDPQKLDNEHQSALLFESFVQNIGLDQKIIQKISNLIILTANHRSATSPQEQLLVDCDLAILGASPDIFFKYDQNIRKEYSFVDDRIYQNARIEVLNKFLNHRHIYKTKLFQDKLEQSARINLNNRINLAHKIEPFPKQNF